MESGESLAIFCTASNFSFCIVLLEFHCIDWHWYCYLVLVHVKMCAEYSSSDKALCPFQRAKELFIISRGWV